MTEAMMWQLIIAGFSGLAVAVLAFIINEYIGQPDHKGVGPMAEPGDQPRRIRPADAKILCGLAT